MPVACLLVHFVGNVLLSMLRTYWPHVTVRHVRRLDWPASPCVLVWLSLLDWYTAAGHFHQMQDFLHSQEKEMSLNVVRDLVVKTRSLVEILRRSVEEKKGCRSLSSHNYIVVAYIVMAYIVMVLRRSVKKRKAAGLRRAITIWSLPI